MVVTLLASLPAAAATHQVCAGCPLDTLAAGVAEADPGDVIEVGPGTWDAALAILVDLTIRATTPRQTFINPTGAEAFVVNGGTTLTLEGFDLVGTGNLVGVGYGAAVLVDILAEDLTSTIDDGVVAHIADGSSLTIRDSTFRDLSAPRGAVATLGGYTTLLVENVVVERATAMDSGGAFSSNGAVTVIDSTFTGCEALGGGYTSAYGGAILVGQELDVTGSTFSDGFAAGHGGFIAQQAGNWDANITASTFDGGVATSAGGAIFVDSLGTVSLTDVDVTGSTAPVAAGLYLAREAQGVLTRGTFADNRADFDGGAVQIDPGYYGLAGLTVRGTTFERNRAVVGGALSLHGRFGQAFSIEDARFIENESTDITGGGGGIHHDGDSSVSILRSIFKDNRSFYGGAVKTTVGGQLSIEDSVFVGNQATNNGGAVLAYNPLYGGMYLQRNLFSDNTAARGGAVHMNASGWVMGITNCAFLENGADDRGGAIWTGSQLLLSSSDLLANTASFGGSAVYTQADVSLVDDIFAWGSGGDAIESSAPVVATVTYSDWWQNGADLDPAQFGAMGVGNLFDDPLLESWTANGTPFDDDLHLAAASTLVDAGGPTVDLDGSPADIGLFGGPGAPVDGDLDGWWSAIDCDDSDATVHPLQPDLCDGVDVDCDGQIDEDDAPTPHYVDGDGDGFGDDDTMTLACGPAEVGGDCDDAVPEVHPGAGELCNDRDDDCDGTADDGVDRVTVWPDLDEDGYGDETATGVEMCAAGALEAERGRDCDDDRAQVHPGAEERAMDGTDQDCDGHDLQQSLTGRSCGCDGANVGGAFPLVALLALRRRRRP